MPLFEFYIMDREKVSNFHDKEITHMVSIGSPGEKRPYTKHYKKYPNTLRLEFDDVVTKIGDKVAFLRSPNYAYPSEEDVIKLIGFAKIVSQADAVCLFHCSAGISRSTAAAFIILSAIYGPGTENACIKMVEQARKIAMPNMMMVEYADKLLNRNEEMIKAVARFNARPLYDLNV